MEAAMSILKALRESSGISQRELAKEAGVSRTAIYDTEQGKRDLPADVMDKISAVIAEKIELSYVAGLFDRRSRISILKVHPPKVRTQSRSSVSPHYIARVEFSSVHPLLLEVIQKVFKCGTFYHSPKKNPVTHGFMAWSFNAEQVLTQLLPYIKLKRPQIQKILELRAIQNYNHFTGTSKFVGIPGAKGKYSHVTNSKTPLDQKTLDKMEALYLEVKRLNKELK
jgi:transcriptional regulator with XRE-family HTH domain